jgi:hypothetical protein
VELLDQRVEAGAIITRAHMRRRDLCADAADMREAIRRADFIRDVDELIRKAGRSDIEASIPGNAYLVSTGTSAVSLSAATAKTVMYTNAAAANQPTFVELAISFDGVTASAVPALVEMVYGTKATNSTPGTGSTTFTALQLRGWPTQTSSQASANNCSSEPTVLVPNRQWLVTPNGGLLLVQFPMGREPTGVASGAAISGIQVGVRCNAPAAVNMRGYYEYEE